MPQLYKCYIIILGDVGTWQMRNCFIGVEQVSFFYITAPQDPGSKFSKIVNQINRESGFGYITTT